MQHTINLQAQYRPEVMERVLRVVRHRGFVLNAMSMQQCNVNKQVNITLHVSGERPVENLEQQLSKLYDVSAIELHQNSAMVQKAIAMNG